MQQFASYESESYRDILQSFPSDRKSLIGKFIVAPEDTFMFSSFTPESLHAIENEPVLYNNHNHGIGIEAFQADQELSAAYVPIMTSVDDNGNEFVAAMESRHYPFFAVLYHPEKQWTSFGTTYNFNHSYASHAVGVKHADFFVAQVRKNNQAFDDYEQEKGLLITNHDILVTQYYEGV
jgi:hypothetical protein